MNLWGDLRFIRRSPTMIALEGLVDSQWPTVELQAECFDELVADRFLDLVWEDGDRQYVLGRREAGCELLRMMYDMLNAEAAKLLSPEELAALREDDTVTMPAPLPVHRPLFSVCTRLLEEALADGDRRSGARAEQARDN